MADVVVGGILNSATDVDTIFEKHTINEIHEISKKIQIEIDKKKEDVRQMVGERYRDLIEAADTISEMKITIEQITTNISSMEQQCSSLQQHQIQHTQESPVKQIKRKQILDQYYAVAVQIKLLMDLPGKFWGFVESGQYLLAAELFFLAKHIQSNLQSYASLGIPVSVWFPIVPRQLVITSHFKRTVLEACKSKLNKPSITADELVQCLSCLLILDHKNSHHVFENFLSARFKLIEDMFKPNKQDISIKEQVCQTIDIIIKTFLLIHDVFVAGSDHQSLLEEVLENVKNSESPIYMVTYLGSPAAKYIPQPISAFRIELPENSALPTTDQFQNSCSDWIQNVKVLINKNLLTMLHFITNVRGLAVICDTVWEMIAENEQSNSWENMCMKLIGRPFKIWEEVFQVLFLKQAQVIVQSYVDKSFGDVFQEMITFMQKDDAHRKYEKDVINYIWREGEDDLPSNIGWITAANRTPLDGGNLFMKSRGFTPHVQSVCQSLNSKLSTLLDDLGSFQQKHDVESEDGEKMQMYLMRTTANNVNQLIEKCKKHLSSLPGADDVQSHSQTDYVSCILMLARLWRALTELCPALSQCLSVTTSVSAKGSSKIIQKANVGKKASEESEWSMVKSRLLDKANHMMRCWKEQVMKLFRKKVFSSVKFWTPEEALLNIPQWDSIKIQEETESGQQVTSTIQVPMHVSSQLFSSVMELCNTANLVGSHTLSRQLLEEFQLEMIKCITDAYEALPAEPTVSQVIALQLLFDLHFFVTISGAKEDKELTDRIQKLIDMLEGHIDPFDLDVFTPYIQTNLRLCIQRSIILLGPLISPSRVSLMTTNSRSALSSHQEHNNVLTLNTASPRFSMLPVGGDVDSSSSSYKNEKKKSFGKLDKGASTRSGLIPSSSSSSSSIKSASSSLFEAMSSSWFRN